MYSSVISVYHLGSSNSIYYMSLMCMSGGGFRNANCGITPENVDAIVLRQIMDYGIKNKNGFVLSLPPEVMAHIPENMRGTHHAN